MTLVLAGTIVMCVVAGVALGWGLGEIFIHLYERLKKNK